MNLFVNVSIFQCYLSIFENIGKDSTTFDNIRKDWKRLDNIRQHSKRLEKIGQHSTTFGDVGQQSKRFRLHWQCFETFEAFQGTKKHDTHLRAREKCASEKRARAKLRAPKFAEEIFLLLYLFLPCFALFSSSYRLHFRT